MRTLCQRKKPAMKLSFHAERLTLWKICVTMFGKDIQEKEKRSLAAVATGIYAALAVFYFLPPDIPGKIALPVALLAAFSFRILPWMMCLALTASALGDFMGAFDNFMGQIEFFALAHLCLIVFFVHRWFHDRNAFSRAGGRQPEHSLWRIIVIGLAVLAVLASAIVAIVVHVPAGVVRVCVAFYAVVICMMLFCALIQKSRAYAAAAILFVFSDALIGWNAFVGPVPGERYLIMVPYYLAQLTFFLRAAHVRLSFA